MLATPVPTNVPWAWTTFTFETVGDGSPNGVWSAGGDIAVLVDNGATSLFRISGDGVNWRTNYSSRAIAGYLATATVTDQLWYALQIAGLSSSHVELAYPKWAEDGVNVTWITKGPVVGTSPDWVGALGQVNGTWVMSPGHYVGDGGAMEVATSDDGIHWSTVRPTGAEDVAIYVMVNMGSKLVAFGQRQSADRNPVALTTTDGRHWKSAAFPGPTGGETSVFRIACTDAVCVASGSVLVNGQERPALWRTANGLDWQGVATEILDARQEGYVSMVAATDSGFIAMGGPEAAALLSVDGTTWHEVNVLAVHDRGQVQQLVVNDAAIFGLGGVDSGGYVDWVGSVPRLPFS